MLAIFFGFNSLVPALPLYMEQYSNIAGIAGFPLAAMTIGAVLSRPFAGWGIDFYGRKNIYWSGTLLFLLTCIAFMAMPAAPFIIALRFIQGIGWGFCHTALNTLASENVPPPRMGEGMGLFTSTTSIAMLISPSIGLWIIGNHSFSHYFTAVASIVLISIIPMFFVKYKAIEKKQQKPKLVFMHVAALQPAMVMLFYCISNSAALSFISIHAMMQGLTNAGVFYIFFPLCSLIFRPYFGRMIDKRREKGYGPIVITGCAAQVIAMLTLANTSSVAYLIVGGCFFGISFGAMQVSMLADSIRKVPPDKRGAANATFWTAFDTGMALGSIMWGMLAAVVGYYLVFHLAVIPVLIALLIYFISHIPFIKRTPNKI